jgi:hypothetical protein
MSRNGSGTYSLPAGNPVVTGTTITSSWANTTMQNIADALTQSVASDGQTPMSGVLNMATNKIINVSNPTLAQDAATKTYVDAKTDGTASGSFTSLAYSTTLTGGTGIVNLGSGQFYKDASGNVGIGTSSPTQKLTIFDTTNSTTYQMAIGNVAANSYNIGRNFSDGLLTFYGTQSGANGYVFSGVNGERMRIDSSGNVGIGTSSPVTGLSVSKSSGFVQLTDGTIDYRSFVWTGNASAAIGTWSNHALLFNTNNTERCRIDTSGNFLFGTTSATSFQKGVSIEPNYGNVLARVHIGHGNGTSSGELYLNFYYNAGQIGSISQNGTTGVSYNTSSDYRLKENIAPMTGALAKVLALKAVTYNWKVDGSNGQGFIAHELQAVVPDCVTGKKDAVDENGNPQYQGIDTSFLVATLTAAIQELNAKVISLEAQLGAK